jgi:transcriptional regulator with XRE-family HTH domain
MTTEISERAAFSIRTERQARGWSMTRLSRELAAHRCAIHPEGFRMSAAVINHIENGVSAQGGYPAHRRSVTVDELFAFSEVFGVPVENLVE